MLSLSASTCRQDTMHQPLPYQWQLVSSRFAGIRVYLSFWNNLSRVLFFFFWRFISTCYLCCCIYKHICDLPVLVPYSYVTFCNKSWGKQVPSLTFCCEWRKVEGLYLISFPQHCVFNKSPCFNWFDMIILICVF